MSCQKKQGNNRALLKFLGLLTSVNVGKKIEKWLENFGKLDVILSVLLKKLNETTKGHIFQAAG